MAAKKQIATKPETTIVEVYKRDLKRIRTLCITKDYKNNREVISALLNAAEASSRKPKPVAA